MFDASGLHVQHRVHKHCKEKCLDHGKHAFLSWQTLWYSLLCTHVTPYSSIPCLPNILSLDGLDLEMQCYQGEHQRFKILDKVVKDTQTFRVLRFCNVDERANLGGLSLSFST